MTLGKKIVVLKLTKSLNKNRFGYHRNIPNSVYTCVGSNLTRRTIMRSFNLILIILILTFSCSESNEKPKRILTYGLPGQYDEAMEIVGKKWGIEIYPVAGCMVSQNLIDSVKTENQKLWLNLDKINDFESEKKFHRECKIVSNGMYESREIYTSEKTIKEKLDEIKLTSDYYGELESISEDGNEYFWIINSFSKDYISKPEFRLKVNIINKSAELI